jgi:predicted phage-related endonuclease
MVANKPLEEACLRLKDIKAHLKGLEEEEERLQAAIQASMKEVGTLLTFDGRVLATWNQAKGSKRFDVKALQTLMPEVYNRFYLDTPGSRRFLLK